MIDVCWGNQRDNYQSIEVAWSTEEREKSRSQGIVVVNEASSLSKLRRCEEFVKHKLYIQNRKLSFFASKAQTKMMTGPSVIV